MCEYRIRYRGKANTDIENAKNWYENQKEGLGDEFYTEVKEQVKKTLTKIPEINGVRYKNIRKLSLKKFSKYGIYYIINEQKYEITIIAVTHDSRHEQNWKDRV